MVSAHQRLQVEFHSDHDSQYTSKMCQNFCQENNITISMSRKGNCLDNAVVESFFSSLKKEIFYNKKLKNMNEYLKSIHQ
jgi:putative transposase